MKALFFSFIILVSGYAYGQSILPLKADTVRIQKDGGNAELVLRNSTRNSSGAFLKNQGNGVTTFSYVIDSIKRKTGTDSVFIYRGGIAAFAYRDSLGSGGGGVSDGDKGDVTISGSGSVYTVDPNAISDSKLRQSAGLSVVGRSTNSTGNVADITAGSDGQPLRRNGTSLSFGALNLANSNAVTGILPIANIATGTPTGSKFVRDDGTLAVPSGSGTTDHTALSNLGWASSAHTGTANRIAAFDGSGNPTFKQIGVDIQAYNAALAAIVGLSPTNDDVLQYKAGSWSNRTIAQLKTDLNYTIPAQFNPIAGLGVTLSGSYPNITFNSVSDTNWINLRSLGSHGTDDSVILKLAIATGKNVRIDPGYWFTNAQLHPRKGQIIEGYGAQTVLATSKDTGHVFYCIDTVTIRDMNFQGPGIGTDPEGGPVFTGGNAIYLGGSGNRVINVNGFDLKGALVTSWEFGTIYNNKIFNCTANRCTIGFYILTNSEYGSYLFNEAYYCKVGAVDRCAGNNKWDMFTGEFNVVGFRLYGTSGCNGDHGSMSNSTLNHNSGIGLEILGANNGYLFSNMQIILNNITLGTNDTARAVSFVNTALSTSTITATKIAHVRFNGGYLLPGATLTVNGTMASSLEIAGLMNSPYERTVAGTVMGTTALNLQATDSIRAVGVPFSNNDSALFRVLTMNKITGAIAWANWLGAGGGSSYTFSTGLTNASGTVTNNLATGVSGGQTMIGSTGTTTGLTIKASSGAASGANNAINGTGGNNGATPLFQFLHDGSWSLGDNAFSGFGYLKVPASGLLVRDRFGSNILYITEAGDIQGGKTSSSVHSFQGKAFFGSTGGTPTANVHTAASTTSEASLRIPNGTAPTSPNQGDIWQASNNLMFRSNDGNNYQLNNTILENDYTPTASNTANITGSVAVGNFHYIRNGNSVRVWGTCSATITAANTATTFELTLPIASTFTLPQDAVGSGAGAVNNAVQHAVVVVGVTTTVLVSTVATTTGNRAMYFDWNYIVK
jgi:hypothetical protein